MRSEKVLINTPTFLKNLSFPLINSYVNRPYANRQIQNSTRFIHETIPFFSILLVVAVCECSNFREKGFFPTQNPHSLAWLVADDGVRSWWIS